MPLEPILMYTLVADKNERFHQVRLAQSVEDLTTNLKDVSSTPTVGKNFHFVFYRFQRIPHRSTESIQMKACR